MPKKVVYEVFNPDTGEFEDKLADEEEVKMAFDVYYKDYEIYEAERKIVDSIIQMHINGKIHPKLNMMD
tara:strand:- start:696 stop:902 length:207 start_codon:yes stop_codon:yes gene_type:complete